MTPPSPAALQIEGPAGEWSRDREHLMRYWQIVEPEGATHLLSVTFLSWVRYHHCQLKTSAQKRDQSCIIMFIGQLCSLRAGMINLSEACASSCAFLGSLSTVCFYFIWLIPLHFFDTPYAVRFLRWRVVVAPAVASQISTAA
jgi:hypothetical protein